VASSGGPEQYERELMNWAARIGSQLKIENVEKSQIEQLIGSAELAGVETYAPLITATYAFRQAARGYLRDGSARLIAQAMEWLYKNNKGKTEVRRLIGLAKWVYECVRDKRITRQFENYEKFVEFLASEERR
jgi:hypothetical protein